MQSCTQWVHAPLPLQNPACAYPVTLATWLRTDYGRIGTGALCHDDESSSCFTSSPWLSCSRCKLLRR